MKEAHRLEKVARDALEHMSIYGGNSRSHKPTSLLLETCLQQQVFKAKPKSLENTCQAKQTKIRYLRLAINTVLENYTVIYLLSSPKDCWRSFRGHDPWLTCELDSGTWKPLISSLVHVCFTCHSYAKSSCRSTVLRE